jgi:hypothetical protein
VNLQVAPEWLEDSCWRCGSPEPQADDAGRLLCLACRRDLFSSDEESDPLGAVRRLYWEAHPLEQCWRCLERPVDPTDDLGLCHRCRERARPEAADR